MNPNAMAMHPEDAREVLDDATLARIGAREKLVAGIMRDLVELTDFDVLRGTARPLTSASLAAEQHGREQMPPVSSGT